MGKLEFLGEKLKQEKLKAEDSECLPHENGFDNCGLNYVCCPVLSDKLFILNHYMAVIILYAGSDRAEWIW